MAEKTLREIIEELWAKIVREEEKEDKKPSPIMLGAGSAADIARKLKDRKNVLDDAEARNQ